VAATTAVRGPESGMRQRPPVSAGAPAPRPARPRRGTDAVSMLSVYVALLLLVPSSWALPALGAAGTPANVYALAMLLWYLASWLDGRLLPAPGTRAVRIALCCFAVCVLISFTSLAQSTRAPVSTETLAADRGLISLAAWTGVLVVSSSAIFDLARLQQLLRRMVVCGSAVAGLGMLEFVTKRDLLASVHVPGLRPSTSLADLMVRGAFARPSSTASHPLELSGVLAMLLPFAIQQALDPARFHRGRLRRWLPVALIGGSLPLTVSRTSIIGLAVVLLVLLPTWKPQRRWPAFGVIAVGVGVMKVAVPGLISTTFGLFSAFLGSGDDSTQARAMDYAGVAQYIEQRPLFGRGFRTFIPALYRYTDNQYLLAVVEIGIIGAVAIVGLYLTGIWCGRAGRRRWTDEPTRELGQSFVAAMAVALVVSATFDTLGFPMFAGLAFLLLGCAGAYLGISRREAGAGASTSPETVAEAAAERPAEAPAPVELYRISEIVRTSVPVHVPAYVPEPEPEPEPEPDLGPEPEPVAELETPPPAEPEIGHHLRRGVRWSFVNTVIMRLGNFLTGVILARGLLGPRDWGLYAIGLVALAVLLSANELGVSLAIVRWEGDPRRFAPTVLTLSLVSSLFFYALLYLSAPGVARLLGASDATTMLRVLGIAVLIDGVACVPAGVLTRTFAQRKRMFIDLGNFVVSSGLTIGLAVGGAGAMSFAWGSIAGNVVALAGCAIAAPGFLRPGWDREQARALLGFGLPLAGASLLVLAMLNVDSVVIGATLGPIQLGLYQIAFNVSSWPVRSVSEVARRVSFAGFSRVADSRAALSESFGRGLTLLMTAAVPACVLLAVLPKPIIYAIYGQRWTAASGALRFLALLGLLRVAFELAYDCLVASGRRKALIITQGWWLVALIPVLVFAARDRGIAGVGAGHILVAGPLVAPLFLWALNQAGISPAVVARACARPFLGGALMAGAALALGLLHLNQVVYLFLAGAAALAVYVPVVWPILKGVARDRS
jgi:O-antigen/teichoic acid export membrane protein/O-antigen ligase